MVKVRFGVLVLAALLLLPGAAQAKAKPSGLKAVKHIIVIYEENHSFDNLYGGWERVDGLKNVRQVDQAGQAYACLKQNDVNLTTPPLGATCSDPAHGITSAFPNKTFPLENFIARDDTTCPAPGANYPSGVPKGQGQPGGCTRDLVHRFYQEQYQLDGGKQDRYVTGSDAIGTTMGVYGTRMLPIYGWLHKKGHPRYVIADRFFQSAFGGSFLNHQWLVAAASPVWRNAVKDLSPNDLHSTVDANGMPNTYPLYTPTGPVRDGALTQACPTVATLLCGDFAVNTIQPTYQPFAPGTLGTRQLPPQTGPTIGDRLSGKGISWAWYSGGWSNAAGNVNAPGWTNGNGPACSDPGTATGAVFPNCPGKLFQYHHQPLNYYATFAPGTPMRARHLRDEAEFISLTARSRNRCRLKTVSLIKPIGQENEHPGYASEHTGSDHLVSLLSGLQHSPCKHDTMVVVTYDEFGGQFDHVPPPGQGSATKGVHDLHGPGTRIPALILAPGLKKNFAVDHTSHDTTSIAATIEHRFKLKALSSRDKKVKDLSSAFKAK